VKVAVVITEKFNNEAMLAVKLKEFIDKYTIGEIATVTKHAYKLVNSAITNFDLTVKHDDARGRLDICGRNNKVSALCKETDMQLFFYNGHPNKPKKTAIRATDYSRTGNALEELVSVDNNKLEKIHVFAYKRKTFKEIKVIDNFIEIELDNDMQKRNSLKSILLDKDEAVKLARDILIAVSCISNSEFN
jgi:hypothetical protein